MPEPQISFSVFTKPWPRMPLTDLARFVRRAGFDAVELPVRPGFQVEPEQIATALPDAARILAAAGLRIASVATIPTTTAIATCGELGIPIIRVMAEIGADGYTAAEARLQEEYAALQPTLRAAGVLLGVQNHYGGYVCHAAGLRALLAPLDPAAVGAIWDAAHNALSGEEAEHAIDIIWSRLCMVNLKNAFWRRITGPEAEAVAWRPYWTSGRQGLASWPRVMGELRRRGYRGTICLTAEYSDEPSVERLITADLAYARALWETPAA